VTTPLYPAEKYTYRVLWSEERQRYVGVCSEFPALSYEATTHAGALGGIIARVREELESKTLSKETPPVPTAIRQLKGSAR
jgi:hypothetical protein